MRTVVMVPMVVLLLAVSGMFCSPAQADDKDEQIKALRQEIRALKDRSDDAISEIAQLRAQLDRTRNVMKTLRYEHEVAMEEMRQEKWRLAWRLWLRDVTIQRLREALAKQDAKATTFAARAEQALSRRVPVEFDGSSIDDVAAFLRAATGLNVVVLPMLRSEDPLTDMRIDEISVKGLLALLEKTHGLTADLRWESIVLGMAQQVKALPAETSAQSAAVPELEKRADAKLVEQMLADALSFFQAIWGVNVWIRPDVRAYMEDFDIRKLSLHEARGRALLDVLLHPYDLRWSASDRLVVVHAAVQPGGAKASALRPVSPVLKDPALAKKVSDTRVNVTLENQILTDVLELVSAQAGVRLLVHADLRDELEEIELSGTFKDLPLGLLLGILAHETSPDAVWVEKPGALMLQRR